MRPVAPAMAILDAWSWVDDEVWLERGVVKASDVMADRRAVMAKRLISFIALDMSGLANV